MSAPRKINPPKIGVGRSASSLFRQCVIELGLNRSDSWIAAILALSVCYYFQSLDEELSFMGCILDRFGNPGMLAKIFIPPLHLVLIPATAIAIALMPIKQKLSRDLLQQLTPYWIVLLLLFLLVLGANAIIGISRAPVASFAWAMVFISIIVVALKLVGHDQSGPSGSHHPKHKPQAFWKSFVLALLLCSGGFYSNNRLNPELSQWYTRSIGQTKFNVCGAAVVSSARVPVPVKVSREVRKPKRHLVNEIRMD